MQKTWRIIQIKRFDCLCENAKIQDKVSIVLFLKNGFLFELVKGLFVGFKGAEGRLYYSHSVMTHSVRKDRNTMCAKSIVVFSEDKKGEIYFNSNNHLLWSWIEKYDFFKKI